MSNFIKILSLVAEFFNVDGQPDARKVIVAFHNFANELKKIQACFCRKMIERKGAIAASVVQRQRAGIWYPSSPVSNPTEAVGFFRAKKILSTPSFGGEVKPSVPCRRFTACKRSLNVTWKSGVFRKNSSAISRPMQFHLRLLGSLEDDQWRKLEHSKIRRFINISTSGRQDLIEGDQR